uniref:Uncharacterized protein n=1 Tax=Oryza nivara TaxID=4536 RepID=A0A1Y8Z4S3_ORYNI
MALQALD